MFKSVLTIMACVVLCTGCVKSVQKPARTEAVTFMDMKLRDAAESISKDMAQLSGSAQNRDYTSEKGSGSLYVKMDMTWDGPIEGALREVASTAGFRFNVEGDAPVAPVIIHVRLKDRPALAVLREIGMQTGASEGVIINEDTRTIVLKYLGKNKG